ncbi:IS3 family transposase [Fusobacterium ulcerans]|uniref:IS3 family transposase n=1 Tax=Fusobacterium ulcerans TaxID=861 RepID=UPI0039B44290
MVTILKVAKRSILIHQITKIHQDSRKIYGAPRIATILNANQNTTSPKFVAKFMKENSTYTISHKKFRKESKPSKNSIEHNLIKGKKLLLLIKLGVQYRNKSFKNLLKYYKLK